jgi:hypothetical protein
LIIAERQCATEAVRKRVKRLGEQLKQIATAGNRFAAFADL